jgi:NAD+-dependent protein deacetylase SIR2
MLCLGSSMRVHPAAEMAEITATRKYPGKIIIVNLQKTPLDNLAYMNIHCKIDDFFTILMKKLDLEIPEFKLQRWIEAELEVTKSGKERLNIKGITDHGQQYDLFKNVLIDGTSGYTKSLSEAEMKEDKTFDVKFNW